MNQVHAQARTTPRVRAEIKASSARLKELARCVLQRVGYRAPIVSAAPSADQWDVERSNGRISQAVKQTRFAKAAQLEATLMNYVKAYSHQIPQRALQHVSAVHA